jgi:hypothetical protein
MVPIVEVLNWHARKHALQNAAAAATITLSKSDQDRERVGLTRL